MTVRMLFGAHAYNTANYWLPRCSYTSAGWCYAAAGYADVVLAVVVLLLLLSLSCEGEAISRTQAALVVVGTARSGEE